MKGKSALVLLSGGQDSATCLAWAKKNFAEVHTISFDYGQRHIKELTCAQDLSIRTEAKSHTFVDVKHLFQQVTKSRLMEKSSALDEKSEFDESLPASFVPYRNVFFMTSAAATAYFMGIKDLICGVCQTDYSGYPDCRNEFVKSMNTSLSLASQRPLEIHTPLMWLTKAETVLMMKELGHLNWYRYTLTCYEGTFPPCRECPACQLRAKGFQEAGIEDPLLESG